MLVESIDLFNPTPMGHITVCKHEWRYLETVIREHLFYCIHCLEFKRKR